MDWKRTGAWVRLGLVWLGRWLGFIVVFIACGAVIGGVVGWPVSLIFGMGFPAAEAALNGASIGARFVGVWAGGLSLVTCFMYGHHLNRRKTKDEG